MTNLYSATLRQWDHVGSVTGEFVHQEDTHVINFEAKPAAWLPVLRQEKSTENWITIPGGVPVALDGDNRVVPAGYKKIFENAGGSTVLTYTTDDVAQKVIDITTGLAVTAAVSYTQTQVTNGLIARGKIASSEYARDFISWPIGFAYYNMFNWCGGDGSNPADYNFHNNNAQHQVAVANDMAVRVPLVPYQESAETQGGGIAIADTAIVLGTAGWKSSTGIAATTLYSSLVSAGDNVVAMVLNKWPVAKITTDTPITDSASTLASMTEVDSIAALLLAGSGYFFVDYDHGVIFLYESGGNAIPTGFSAANTVTYYTYETAATGSWTIAHAVGNLKPGDFVTFNDRSNYAKLTSDIGTCFGGASGDAYAADPDYSASSDAAISAQLEQFVQEQMHSVIGQVVGFWVHPRSSLDKVRTQFTAFTNYERTAGTATGGRPQSSGLAGAANLEVIINFCTR